MIEPMTDAEFYDIQLCAVHTESYVAHRLDVEDRQLVISGTLRTLLTTPDSRRCIDLERAGLSHKVSIYAAALESPELTERERRLLHETMARVLL